MKDHITKWNNGKEVFFCCVEQETASWYHDLRLSGERLCPATWIPSMFGYNIYENLVAIPQEWM